jgi:hypothetical protein
MKRYLLLLLFVQILHFGYCQNISQVKNKISYFGSEGLIINASGTDHLCNIYITGKVYDNFTDYSDFITEDAYQNYYGGGILDAFIVKFDANLI